MINDLISTKDSITQEIQDPLFESYGVQVFIKRDDLIHSEISGNKWRKLKYNIAKCLDQRSTGILTFGGAYSNHLVATAAAANLAELDSVGIVRGDELDPNSNSTLKRCIEYGMKLKFIPRSSYDLRAEKYFQEELLEEHSNYLLVPEGGANYYGIIGCQEIMTETKDQVDHVFVAQGTTTTSCGILSSLTGDQKLWGVSSLKGFDSRSEMELLMLNSGFDGEYVNQLMSKYTSLESYHFGGYAKYNENLLHFIRAFHQDHQIKLDPVYTGKAMYALMDSVRKGLMDNSKVLFVHTGGVQGAGSIEKQSGIELYPD